MLINLSVVFGELVKCNTFLFISLSVALTKLDILDTLPEIKVGIAYTVDEKPLPSFPG